ncbi:MAG: hypothetical protein OXI08_03650, partial [Cyanobacteria bacterium MAG IRC4_bin_6]|nr:hypothetical protein [Cyanobacteria bacterium MAG IRC4_bin_6]
MRVVPWRRWGRLLSSRPEASCSSSTVRFRLGSPLLPLLLSLPLVAGPASEARAQTTFVKNTGQTTASNFLQFTWDSAQAFTTGNNAAGYKLTSAKIKFASIGQASDLNQVTVAIHADSSGSPGSSVGTLTASTITTGTNPIIAFTASGQDINLVANTQYWIVVDVTSSNNLAGMSITLSNSEDAGSASGWSIANGGLFRGCCDSSSTWAAANVIGRVVSLQIEIIGTAKTANTAATGAPTITGAATQGQTL